MEQLPWHQYAGESAEELLSLANTHRADSLVVAFEMALGQKAARLGDHALSAVEHDVLAIEALEREVNNGGYGQFFSNSSNEHAGHIVTALERIGCGPTAAITARAIASLPAGIALTPESLDAEMARADNERDTRLEECNDTYLATPEDIAAQLLQYLLSNRAELRLLPE